mgnify:CR=1 FL=1
MAVLLFAEANEAYADNGRHRRGQTQDQNEAAEERGVADGYPKLSGNMCDRTLS